MKKSSCRVLTNRKVGQRKAVIFWMLYNNCYLLIASCFYFQFYFLTQWKVLIWLCCLFLVLIVVFPSSDGIPQRNRLDFVDLNLPLENLLDLTFIWTVFHLLPTNHIKELWCQDKVSLHGLWNNRKSNISEGKEIFRDSIRHDGKHSPAEDVFKQENRTRSRPVVLLLGWVPTLNLRSYFTTTSAKSILSLRPTNCLISGWLSVPI